MKLTFTGFEGANKAVHPLLLPETVGVDSLNQRPGRGDLRAWRAPLNVGTVPAGRASIYRMGRDAPSDASYWLSSATEADYVRSFIADDSAERTYWTDGLIPKWTDNSIGLGAPPYPAVTRLLGVPVPGTANTEMTVGTPPTVTLQAAGGGAVESRYYVVTWVNDRGEESAPSPVSALLNVNGGSTVRVTRASGIPSGAWGLAKWRIYRTMTGASGATEFAYVGEALDSAAYFDDAIASTANPLPSATWVRPPLALRGLKALWNGIMAGFVGKSLRFSAAYRPFAWPIQYELVVDDTIVALAVWQQNLLVLTTGKPYLVTGSAPDSMSLQPLELDQSCVSKKSVVEFGHGVVWASPDGLTYTGQAGTKVITAQLYLRDDWQALKPETMVGGQADGQYLCSYDPGGGRVSLLIDPVSARGVYPQAATFTATFHDTLQDALYLLNGTNVQRWDGGAAQAAMAESKTFRTPRHGCFGFGQVTADAYPVQLSIWAQGMQRLANYAVQNARPFRLPAGFRADEWRMRITTPVGGAVQGLVLADSTQELQTV